jgi:hypothetical protein
MRNPKTKEETVWHQVSYRLKDAEFLPLQVVAERTGESVNQLARRLATQGRIEAPPFPGFRPDPAVIARLNDVGLTLRKIEKASQDGQSLPPELAHELAEVIKEIRAYVEAAILERVKE